MEISPVRTRPPAKNQQPFRKKYLHKLTFLYSGLKILEIFPDFLYL